MLANIKCMLQEKHKSLYGRDVEVCEKVKLLAIISKIPTVSNRKQNIKISKTELFQSIKNIKICIPIAKRNCDSIINFPS